MTPRRINSMLYLAAAALSVASLAAVASIFVSPTQSVADGAGAMSAPPSTGRATARDEESQAMLASLEPVFSRPLRSKPLAAPVATAAPRPATRPVAVPPLALAGTIGNSTALLRTADGSVIARSIGQKLGDAEVVAVRAGEVELRAGGRVVTLRKAPSTGAVTP